MSTLLSPPSAQQISTTVEAYGPPTPTVTRGPRTATHESRRRTPIGERLPRMARAFTTLFLEVEAGLRPRRQVRRLMCPSLYARLSEVWIRPGAGPSRVPRVLSVHGTHWAPGRYDVVATVDRDVRITALAFCLRRTVDGWLVADLVRPEDGPLPDPPYPVPQNEPDIFELVLG